VTDPAQLPFDTRGAEKKCVPHADGEPKHTVYVAIYRVLEQMPMGALGRLFLTTPDGRVLALAASSDVPATTHDYHLYQEICPVHPRIVSSLGPREFCEYITNPGDPIHVPKICFVELKLGELATDPERGRPRDLPYRRIDHLRDCLIELREYPEKHTKTVDRVHPLAFPYRSVASGLFVGSGKDCLYYPFPAEADLKTRYYEWWRSATMMGDGHDL
jgi:hypothetical protein